MFPGNESLIFVHIPLIPHLWVPSMSQNSSSNCKQYIAQCNPVGLKSPSTVNQSLGNIVWMLKGRKKNISSNLRSVYNWIQSPCLSLTPCWLWVRAINKSASICIYAFKEGPLFKLPGSPALRSDGLTCSHHKTATDEESYKAVIGNLQAIFLHHLWSHKQLRTRISKELSSVFSFCPPRC